MTLTAEEHRSNEGLVKPIIAVLTSDTTLLDRVLADCEPHFGPCDYRGAWYPFTHTTYYEDEMGPHLMRAMCAFEKLIPGHEAHRFKAWTAAIENRYLREGKRSVNLDPGYVDQLKVTLVSGKVGGHKVAVAPGVWVDYLLWYNKGWNALPWAFPDFRDGTYFSEFTEIRKKFKEQIRQQFLHVFPSLDGRGSRGG